jgi:hypothetical protein
MGRQKIVWMNGAPSPRSSRDANTRMATPTTITVMSIAASRWSCNSLISIQSRSRRPGRAGASCLNVYYKPSGRG